MVGEGRECAREVVYMAGRTGEWRLGGFTEFEPWTEYQGVVDLAWLGWTAGKENERASEGLKPRSGALMGNLASCLGMPRH